MKVEAGLGKFLKVMKFNEQRHWWLKKFLPGFILISIGVLAVVWAYRREYHLNNYPKYTVGITHETYRLANQTKHVTYSYYVDGNKYEGSDNFRDSSDTYFSIEENKKYKGVHTKAPGGRYFVKYSANNPEISELLQEKPVPVEIEMAPSEGWERIP